MSSMQPQTPDSEQGETPPGVELLDDLLNGRTEDPQGVRYIDLVRHVLGDPGMDAATCDYILWERTPFPLVRRPDGLRPYLESVRDEIADRMDGDRR